MFYEWLLLQQERTDKVGRLAAFASTHPQFPRSRRLYRLLRFTDAQPEMRKAVKYAHREWRRLQREMAA